MNTIKKTGMVLCIFLLSAGFLQSQDSVNKNIQPSLSIEYYTGIGCPSCAKIDSYIDSVNNKYAVVQIKKYEVFRNKKNFKKMKLQYEKYGVGWDKQWVPVIFFDDKVLSGYTLISQTLEEEIELRLDKLQN